MLSSSYKWLLIFLAVFCVAAIYAVIQWPINVGEDPVDVDLSSSEIVQSEKGRAPLRFAIAPMLSPERTAEGYHALLGYVATQIKQPVRIVQRKTYSEINELLRSGMVQVAILCTGTYLSAQADQIPLEVIAVPVYPEGPVYHSLIVVRRDSGITSIKGLRKRSFAFSDPLSMSGYYYPMYLFYDHNYNPNTFFSRTLFTYSHDGSVKAVSDGITDAAAVDSLVFDVEVLRNSSVGKKLQVIHRSPPLGVTPIVVPASIDPRIRERLRKAFLGMNHSPRGRQILKQLGINRFETPSPTLYETAARIFEAVRRSSGK